MEQLAQANKKPEKSEKELLAELIKLQRKTANRQLAAAIGTLSIAAVLAVAALILVPRVVKITADVTKMVEDTESLISDAQNSLDGLDKMIANVDKVVVDNTQTLTEAVGNIQNIDTDGLNVAIKNLSDAAEPLARLNNQVSTWFGR